MYEGMLDLDGGGTDDDYEQGREHAKDEWEKQLYGRLLGKFLDVLALGHTDAFSLGPQYRAY